jgi:hypothetical protein
MLLLEGQVAFGTEAYMVATLHAGFHCVYGHFHVQGRLQSIRTEPGWKSDMDMQIRLSCWKRPDGVYILIPGGLKGYSEGNRRTPWYSPPAYGESGGPRYNSMQMNQR